MRSMKKATKALFYHSNIGKAAGNNEIVKKPTKTQRQLKRFLYVWMLQPKEKLRNPVTLAAIKSKSRN